MTRKTEFLPPILKIQRIPQKSLSQKRTEVPRPLLELVEWYDQRKIIPAPHQRSPNAWPNQKKVRWISRLVDVVNGNSQPPLGVICTYSISDDRNLQQFLNDGLQRISVSSSALACPEQFGIGKEDIRWILSEIDMVVQKRTYDNHRDAVRDFKDVNNGMAVDPLEKYFYVLVYSKNWESLWESQIDKWNDSIQNRLSSFSRSRTDKRTKLASRRMNLVLFAAANGFAVEAGDNPSVEEKVVECFDVITPKVVDANIRSMKDYCALIEHVWFSTKQERASVMQESYAKWCLGVMMLHHKDAPLVWWERFFKELFTATGPKGNFSRRNEDGSYNNDFISTKITSFRSVIKKLGMEIPDKIRRKRQSRILREGYSNDHKEPFVDFGEGETVPLPSLLNSAKCARRIQKNEDV